jgi:predicted MFS family arabinose efflux permease
MQGYAFVTRAERFSHRYRVLALASITVARIVYSLNWFTLSPGLSQVTTQFKASLPTLGILESTFLLGAGIFQVPASYASAKWNPKLLVVSGLGLMAAANGLGAYSPNLALLIATRFMLGVGAAMFFSPAIAVVAPLFGRERQGIALGIYNSGFSVGGTIGLFGWSYFVEAYGWRFGLMLGAILLAAALIVVQLVIMNIEGDPGQKTDPKLSLTGVLRDRQIWLIALGILGMWSAYYTVGQLFPFYENSVKNVSLALSGFMASLILIIPIFGAPIGGWISDRTRNRKAFLLYPPIAFGVGTALLGYSGLNASIAILAILGLMDAFTFTAMYASPYQMKALGRDQRAIAISLMNSVQIVGSFILPVVFTLVAKGRGYDSAWLASGIFVLAFVPFLLFVQEPFKPSRQLETIGGGKD